MSTHTDTQYNADSCEFCPLPGLESYLACGTYQLDESTKSRVGKLILYDANVDGLKHIGEFGSIGILDIKWSSKPINSTAVLAQALADGRLSLLSLDNEKRSFVPLYEAKRNKEETGDAALCLSLEWSNRLPSSSSLQIVTSYSDGEVAVWEITSAGLQELQSFAAHELEAWIAVFNCWDTNVVWSGADDCLLRGWDLRAGASSPLFSKRHDMGVTTIQFNTKEEYKVAVGCYDEHLSLWDTRAMARPYARVRAQGGGVWRAKWMDRGEKQYIATACMHSGFQTWKWENDKLSHSETYTTPHTSLAYGMDWAHDKNGQVVIACASFYDHLLSIWRPQLG